jgi:hypothetical protein
MILGRKGYYRIICFILCLLTATYSYAQINDVPTVILHKKRVLHLQLVHQQIKVTAKNLLVIKHGTQRANLSAIERIGYSKFNKLLTVTAFTITPKGDTLHVTRFSDQSAVQSGIFYDDYMERTFLFPGVINGATSHLYYTEELSEPRFLGAYYFNASLPVQLSEFEIHCDKHIKLDFSTFNTTQTQVLFQQKKQRKEWLYTWKAVNIPVFRRKEGEQEISYRAPHIIPRIAYYWSSEKVKIPLLSNVADLYAWYGGLVSGTDEGIGSDKLQQMADSLTAGLKTPEAKAHIIFKWVQQNIQYIAFEDGYGGLIPRKAADVLRKRYGDCKDMTALLVALMKRAGIEAYFTWIGTRRLPYRYTELPTPMVDNHMIATIKINNQLLFLDATDPELPFGMPSAMIQGKEALIGKSRYAYEIKTVPPVSALQNVLQDSAVVILSPTDTITVTGSISGSGYFKSELRNKQPLFNSRNITTSVWKIQSPTSDTVKQVLYSYTAPHATLQQNQQVYFNPHIVTARYQEKWLPPTTPFNHWELDYAFTMIQKQLIRPPQGWEVALLPPDAVIQCPDFGFSIHYEKKTDGIIITRTIFVNSLSIHGDEIVRWQKFSEAYNLSVRQNIIFNTR